jgi:hypothetical protein
MIGIIFQSAAVAQNNVSEKLAISQVLIQQQLAWNNGNIDEYMNYYWHNDSLQFIGKKGLTYGYQNTLNNYKKSYPDTASMGKLFFNILHIDLINKNCAYVVGKWNLIRNAEKGNLGGHFTLILKKINKKWVIVSDHSS